MKNHHLWLIGLCVLAFFATAVYMRWQVPVATAPAPDTVQMITVTTIVADGADHPMTVPAGTTALEMLTHFNHTDPAMQLETTTHPGLGTLVESMYGKRNGADGQYWYYHVNGTLPMLGADTLAPKDGDRIEWSFGASAE